MVNNSDFKQIAKELRIAGLSLENISKRIGISKSTASLWLRKEPIPPQFRRSKSGQRRDVRIVLIVGDKPKRKGVMKNGKYSFVVAPKGYPGEKYRGRYAYEHHVVWWRNGMPLPRYKQVIHHKDGNHRNNDFNNLVLLTEREHRSLHGSKPWTYVFATCSYCGSAFRIKGSIYRTRVRVCGDRMFCGRECQHKSLIKNSGK